MQRDTAPKEAAPADKPHRGPVKISTSILHNPVTLG